MSTFTVGSGKDYADIASAFTAAKAAAGTSHTNNKIVSVNGYALSYDHLGNADANTWAIDCDRNLYYTISGANLIELDGGAVDSPGLLNWNDTYAAMAGNDTHSVIANPFLVDSTSSLSTGNNSRMDLL